MLANVLDCVFGRKHRDVTWKAFMRERSTMEGLLSWMLEMYWDRPRLWKDCLTVREASERLVANESGHVSLTQLNPMDTILLEIASIGCLLRPSATTGAKCDTQFTHDSFTRCPPSLTIHRELVFSGTAITGLVWEKMIIRKDTRGRKEKKKSCPIFSFGFEYALVRRKRTRSANCYLDRNCVIFPISMQLWIRSAIGIFFYSLHPPS